MLQVELKKHQTIVCTALNAGISPLGNFHRPLSMLCQLVAIKPVAAAIAAHPRWCPPQTGLAGNGRAFEDASILGSFFTCSALPDVYPAGSRTLSLMNFPL